MKKIIVIYSILTLFSSCLAPEEEDDSKKVYVVCSIESQSKGECTRFMDRTIHLSFSTGDNPNKNNAFQKQEVIDAFNEISQLTDLGAGYFKFKEVDPVLIEPVFEEQTGGEFLSFVQILPDSEFNEIAGNFGYIPDPNAVTVINSANKRQFYILLRASCFTPNNINCTNDGSAIMGTNGIRALVARQLSLLVGIPLTCSNGVLKTGCADFPSDDQWTLDRKSAWAASYNNALETISNNPDFYEEFFLE